VNKKIVNTKIRKRKKESEKIRLKKAKKKERNLPSHGVEQKTQWFRGWDAELERYHHLYNPDAPTTKPLGRR
jgi:hypothetical protein